MLKKILSILVVCSVLLATLSLMGSAAWEEWAYENGNVFTSSWEKTCYADSGRGTIKYGFSKVLVNEDYVKTYHNVYSHEAYVENQNGQSTVKSAVAGKWTKSSEIRHSNGGVYYCIRIYG